MCLCHCLHTRRSARPHRDHAHSCAVPYCCHPFRKAARCRYNRTALWSPPELPATAARLDRNAAWCRHLSGLPPQGGFCWYRYRLCCRSHSDCRVNIATARRLRPCQRVNLVRRAIAKRRRPILRGVSKTRVKAGHDCPSEIRISSLLLYDCGRETFAAVRKKNMTLFPLSHIQFPYQKM